MWSNNSTSKVLVIVVCFLLLGVAGCGNGIGSHGGNATTSPPSAEGIASLTSVVTANGLTGMKTMSAAPFRVTSIDMSVTPTTISTWKCGSFIQVVYNAVFHVVSGPNGGTIVFSYTLNNGRSQTFEKLTILPGQHLSNFVFTWQGSLPSDHTYPGPGGVLVTSPNNILSKTVFPAGRCR
jgi:hypothetical protein